MTNYKCEHCKGVFHIEAKGHASGSAEVCAGISALMYTLADAVDKLDGVKIKKLSISDGYFLIEFSGNDRASVLYETFKNGLDMIAEEYSAYCRGEK